MKKWLIFVMYIFAFIGIMGLSGCYIVNALPEPKPTIAPTPTDTLYFQIVESPLNAQIGERINVVAKTNIHLLDKEVIAYLLDFRQVQADGKKIEIDEMSFADNENMVSWRVQIPDSCEPGTAKLSFYAVTHYTLISHVDSYIGISRILTLKK